MIQNIKLKTIIAAILLFRLIEPTIMAGFFSKGSLDKPVEIDEKQKSKLKFSARISNIIFFDGSDELELEIHNDSDWNISEIKIKVKVGEETRSYIFADYTDFYEKIVDGKPINPKVQRNCITKNRTATWKANVGKFIKKDFTFSIESIKGFED